jgi:alkyldihydroxyacetonephosphate synthase
MTIERTKIRWNGWGWTALSDEIASKPEVWSWLAAELGMPALPATPACPLDEVVLPASRISEADRERIVAIVGKDRVHDDPFERAFHALGRSYHDLLRLRSGTIPGAPDLVAYPRAAEEVLALLAFASERDIAVVPYGGGTSVVGGISAGSGRKSVVLTIDLSGMDRMLSVDTNSLTATAEAGISGPALEKALQPRGLTLGHYPQSFEFSTLGGWIAHRGAGQGSNSYGRVEDWLLGVELATPRGPLATKPSPASSTGPDLTEMIIGSEGVFGIVTKATVRVRRIPQARVYRAYLFHSFESGQDAIRRSVQEDIPATMLRLSDKEETKFYRAFGSLGRKPGAARRVGEFYLRVRDFDDKACVLIAGFEGSGTAVAGARKRFAAIARGAKALSLGEAQGRRWLAGRFHGPYLRDPMMDRGVGVDTLETASSWSGLSSLYASVRRALEESIRGTVPRGGAKGAVMCHISHSYGDGASLYFTCVFPRALGSELAQWRTIKQAATDAIVTNGGTLSHHHGVGEDHLPWMLREKGVLGIEVLRAVKAALDPHGILNPGKLIPPA